ncbi:hypothetical protein AURDEDRAFT_178497 [Auricularia subglabra TFB-10046 SS5]|uniref:Uncharacterized protein n=1 Tax=Auricularia subglabra (strain TFB-10046 / SS5) TaxID=717982 RepID=J0CQH4_AURST|nr:hypothetical protein AURDEDRAFT_178497 [Auricularia subglabra TFB-10046 SS5]
MSTAPTRSNAPSDARIHSNAVSASTGGAAAPGETAPRVNGAAHSLPPGPHPTVYPTHGISATTPRAIADYYYSGAPSAAPAYSAVPAITYDTGRALVLDPYQAAGRIATELTDVVRPALSSLQTLVSDTSARSERAATMGKRAYRAVGDLRVAMTSQTSSIASTLERAIPRTGKTATVEDVRRVTGLEIAKAKLSIAEAVAADVGHRFMNMNEHLAHIERGVDKLYNNSRFQRELLVRLAELVDTAEFGRKKHKKGAVRSTTLIGTAARAAAPYLRPPVRITADHANPVSALFQREELFEHLAGDLSPLSAASPEYEPEDGVLVDVTNAPAASSSTGGI